MTIYQQPDSLSLSGNIKDIILTDATDKVVFRLSVGSTLILEHIYYPDEEHRIVIDIRRFVEEQLSFSLTYSTNPWEQPLLARSFSFTAGNLAAQTFTAIRTGIDHPGETAANWLRSNFLTWQPTVKHVTYSTPELLTYYAASACKVQIKVYYPNGTSDMLTAITLTAGVWTIPVSYAVIASRLGLTGQEALQQAEQLPGAYDVWIEDTSGNRLTYVQRYVAGNTRENEQWILFENSLGGVDCFRAYGQGSLETEHEHQLTDVDDETDEYRVDTVRRIRKSTGWMNMAERRWMLDFFPSRHRWICEDGVFRSIVLTEDSATYTLDNMPAEFEFTFRYTTNLAYLNVPRLLVPPSVLNITAPDLQSFSLPPRLAEFPRLDPSEGALIPVQSPYSDSWSVISAADLISGTSADISRLERMINAEADARRLIQASLDDMFTKDTSTIPARIRANYSLYTNGHLLGMAGVAAGGITDPSSQGGGGGAAYTLSGDIPSANNLKLTLTSDDETLFPSSEVNVSAEGLAEFVKSGTALKLRVTDANVWGAVSGHLLGDGKILPAFLPDYLLGQVMYGGSVNGAGVCTLTQSFKDKYGVTSLTLSAQNASSYEGVYFIASANGTSGIPQTLAVLTGDWIISNGTAWTKIDNTDAVASVNGKTGVVVLDKGDVGLGDVENTKLSTWAGSTNLTILGTIATGVWHGTSIADAYIASASTWNAKQDKIEDVTDTPQDYKYVSAVSQTNGKIAVTHTDFPIATTEHIGMVSILAQSFAGDKSFTGFVHSDADVIGLTGVAAGGITDPSSSGSGGTTDHAELDNLGFDESGHTGFQRLIDAAHKLAYSLISGTPTSLPASDVYAWAKAATKPSYTFSEIEGTASANQIPSLDASKITTGTFADARIASAATWNAKYDKPGTGIPLADLAADVQTSLGKADSAVQKTDVNLVTGSDSVNDNFSVKLTVKDVTKTLVGIRLTGDTLVPAIIRNVVREAAGDWSCGLGTIQVDGSGKFTIGAVGTYALEAQNGLAYAYLGCNAYNGLNLRITASALTWGTDTIWHAGNSNKITVDWSAKNLTLAGSISGATTIEASGKIHTLSEVVGDSGVAAGGITDPTSSGGGGGGTVEAIKVNNTQYDPDASGIVTLPGYYTKEECDAKYLTLNAGSNLSDAVRSLQSQIDSVATKDSFDNLTATSLFADMLVGRDIYGALHGNADTATNAQMVNGHTVLKDVPSDAVFTDTHDTNVAGTGIAVSGTRGSTIAISSAYQAYIANGQSAYSELPAIAGALQSLQSQVDSLASRYRIDEVIEDYQLSMQTWVYDRGYEPAIQSLQSQIDSVSARDSFDELTATSLFVDMLVGRDIYGELHGNADTVDGEHSSAFAHIGAHNNLTASGNEFTFASSGFSGGIYLNYRTAGGTNGNITDYHFGNGKGGTIVSLSTLITQSSHGEAAYGWGDWRTRVGILEGYFSDGSAKKALQLTIARDIWGQSFNGTAAISGDMSSVGKINFTAQSSAAVSGNVLEAATINSVLRLHTTLPFHSDGNVSAGGYLSVSGTGYFAGNVGIGTTPSSYNLHVHGTAYIESTLRVGSTLTAAGNVLLPNTKVLACATADGKTNCTAVTMDSSNLMTFGQGALNNGYDTRVAGKNIEFRTGTANSARLIITSSGDVGVGTTSPSAKLDVAGDIVGRTGVAAGGLTDPSLTDMFATVETATSAPSSSKQGNPGSFVAVNNNGTYSLYVCLGQVYTNTWLWREVQLR